MAGDLVPREQTVVESILLSDPPEGGVRQICCQLFLLATPLLKLERVADILLSEKVEGLVLDHLKGSMHDALKACLGKTVDSADQTKEIASLQQIDHIIK